jgi:hypothetical protein
LPELKKTPVVIGQLLWQPFDVRFGNTLRRIDYHREMLKLELNLSHVKITSTIAKSQKEEKDRHEEYEQQLAKFAAMQKDVRMQFDVSQKRKPDQCLQIQILTCF